MGTADLKGWITERELIAVFGVNRNTWQRWYREGDTPKRLVVGHLRLYRKADVGRFLDDRLRAEAQRSAKAA